METWEMKKWTRWGKNYTLLHIFHESTHIIHISKWIEAEDEILILSDAWVVLRVPAAISCGNGCNNGIGWNGTRPHQYCQCLCSVLMWTMTPFASAVSYEYVWICVWGEKFWIAEHMHRQPEQLTHRTFGYGLCVLCTVHEWIAKNDTVIFSDGLNLEQLDNFEHLLMRKKYGWKWHCHASLSHVDDFRAAERD